jgi:phosphoglycolate phosphatase-like HAD superfamily hydrolase
LTGLENAGYTAEEADRNAAGPRCRLWLFPPRRGGSLTASPFVFFDVDGTLVQWLASWDHAFVQAAREGGAEVSHQEAHEALDTAFSAFYGDCLRKYAGARDEREFWLDYDGRVLEMLGVTAEPRWAAARVADLLRRPDSIRLFPEVPKVLGALSEAGARLGIITSRPRAAPDLEALGVLWYFDPVIDGFAAAGSKREGRMFRLAAEAARVEGRTAWHVGDSYADDVEAAEAAGLRPVLVDRSGLHSQTDCLCVADLRALLGIMAG